MIEYDLHLFMIIICELKYFECGRKGGLAFLRTKQIHTQHFTIDSFQMGIVPKQCFGMIIL